MHGTVIRNTGSWYIVRTDDGRLFQCKVKGNFRLKGIRSTNPVAVGDNVSIVPSEPHSDEQVGMITEIMERRNYIIRKASNLSKQSHIIAANIDQAALVVTLKHPETSTTFLDRFLASAEAYRVPVLLIFNKLDLLDHEDRHLLKLFFRLYEGLGYPCYGVSATEPSQGLCSMEQLHQALAGRCTLFSGNSGVGKSTLLNALIPGLEARTADISLSHDTGMHTTTFSEMYDLPSSGSFSPGSIIDTPGIKGFGTFDMDREEVSHYFREIFNIGQDCRFGNCTHTHEPGCAVLAALEENRIARSRYQSYLSMLDDKDEEKYR